MTALGVFVPESAPIIRTGDVIDLVLSDGRRDRYEVVRGADPGTVWVHPAVERTLTLRRILAEGRY